MSKIDKLDLVIEKIQDLKDLQNEKIDNLENSITGFKAKLDGHQKYEEKILFEIKDDQKEIRKDLNEHMEQTMLVREQNGLIGQQTEMLTELHKDNQRRIESNEDKMGKLVSKVITLEEPSKARKYLLNGLKGLGGAAIAVLSIMKFIDYFKL